jgi:hypothetical protein
METAGTVYEGEYDSNRKYTGFGTLTYTDTGIKYVGDFMDGTYHGEGTIYFPSGEKYEALWENGKEVKASALVKFEDGLIFNPVQGVAGEGGLSSGSGEDERGLIQQGGEVDRREGDGETRKIGLEWPYLTGSVGGKDRRFFDEIERGVYPHTKLPSSPSKVQTTEVSPSVGGANQ